MWLELIVLSMFLLDMMFTRNYLRIYREKFPTADWAVAERNPIIRFLIRKFDLDLGIILGGSIILLILTFSLYYLPESWKWFLLGLYYSTNVNHFAHLMQIRKLKGGNNNGKEKRN